MMRLTGCAACAWVTCAALTWNGFSQEVETATSPPDTSIRLAFRGATIDDVLDSLNRMTGLPVVRNAEVPAGTIDFVSPEDHDLASALRVLNTVLQSRGVTIREVDGMLHLEKLDDMQRQDLPTFVGSLPTDLTPDTLVTVVRPLDSAMAEPMAERLAQMVGEYGAVVAMIGQNAVVITETASNARRLLSMLDALDQQDPDGLIEVFPVKHVAASSLITPLTQLMTIKIEKYMPGKKGKLQKVEETSLEGLTFAADDHAGLIIAKGSLTSLAKLGEVVRMLDVPGGSGGARTVRTIPLAVVSPAEVVKRLAVVVAAMPEESRPQMLALPERSSIVLTGPSGEVDDLVAVITAIEGGHSQGEAVAMRLLPLESAAPKAVQAALMGILSGSQRARVRIGLAPDGQSLLFSGPADEVSAVARMAEALDLGGANVPAIRTLRLRPGSLGAVMQAYVSLSQTHVLPEEVEMSVDAEFGVVRLVGEPADVSAMASLLQSLAESLIEQRETRQFVLAHARPSRVSRVVAASARSLLTPADGTPWTAAEVQDIDSLDVLLVTASPDEMDTIASIIDSLDRATPADHVVRLIQLSGAPADIIGQADAAFAQMGGGGFGPARPRVELDGSGDRIVLSGDGEAVALYEQALRRYLELAGPPRSTRVVMLQFAQPHEMATLLEGLAQTRGSLLADGSLRPSIEAFEEVDGLLVTGTDRQHQTIVGLLKNLDVEDQADADVQVIQVMGTNASSLATAVQSALAARSMFRRGRAVASVTAAPSGAALLVTGTPEQIEDVQTIVTALDTGTTPEDVQVRTVYLKLASAEQVAAMMTQLLGQQRLTEAERAHRLRFRLPMPDETSGVRVAADERLNAIIIAGRGPELAAAAEMARQIDSVAGQSSIAGARGVQVIPVQNADPVELAASIEAVFSETEGERAPVVRVDRASGTLLIRASAAQMKAIGDLVRTVDAAAMASSRRMQMVPIDPAHGSAAEIADALRRLLERNGSPAIEILNIEDLLGEPAAEQTGRVWPISPRLFLAMSAIGATPPAAAVSIAVDPNTNSLVLIGSDRAVARVRAMLDQLLTQMPKAPGRLRRIELGDRADANRLARLLTQSMRQITPPAGRMGDLARRVSVTADPDTNALLITATDPDFETVAALIKAVAAPTEEYEVRTIALKRADASSVAAALQSLYDDRARIAGGGARRVTVVGDAAARVLLVAAGDEDYAALQELVKQIDSPASGEQLEIRIFPLTHADAREIVDEVSSMVFELTFGGMWMFNRDSRTVPKGKTVVLHDERLNALIVTGYGDTFDAVEQVIAVLDQPEAEGFARTIKVFRIGSAPVDMVRDVVDDLYVTQRGWWESPGQHEFKVRLDAARRLLVVSGTEEEHAKVKHLLAMLEQSGEGESIVRTFALENARSVEAVEVLRGTLDLDKRGKTSGMVLQDPTGGDPVAVSARIVADARSNALIVTAPERSMQVLAAMIADIDALSPPGEQGVFIIELSNIPPKEAQRVVQAMRLDKKSKDGTMSRVLSEPMTITPLEGRNAVMVLASPSDRDTIRSIFQSIDVEPDESEARMQMVDLRNAEASAVARVLSEILDPANQQNDSPLARAVQEQVRRLSMIGDGVHDPDISLDLTEPIRIIAHESQNAILISSTPSNVAAIVAIVAMLDELPLTDAVTVRIIPLDNMAADEFSRIVQDLFSQGKRLGVRPGSGIQGVPAGIIGRALLGDVAMTVDARTNTVIVAGTDDAVATVEVLVDRLDSQVASGWLDTQLVLLEWADAEELAALLQRVLIEGADDFPGAASMQKQAGRLRMIAADGKHVVESDVFRPMHELTIVPHETLNALLIIGMQENLDLAVEMVRVLDVEEASPAATVRFFPLEHASAAHVANTVTRLFDQQVSSGVLDREDRVSVQADERTNTIIVTTSSRSFMMLKEILRSLDAPLSANFQEINLLPLEHATASRMAAIVQRMMDARLDRLRSVEPETADLQRVTVMTDERTNSLIVAAGQDTFEVVERLVAELDGSELVQRGLIEVIPADRTNAARVAQTINAVMQRRYSDVPANVRSARIPLVLVDTRSNSLLVSAGPDDLEAIRDLVAKLADAPTDPAIGLHLLPVNGTAQAERLAPRLQQLMRERQRSLGESATPTDRVSIQPDGGTNSLIVAASRENLEVIEGLLAVLQEAEEARGTGRELEVISLQVTNARAMVEMLDDLYVKEANRLRGNGSIRVTADERLNAVLVSASSHDIAEIRSLVGRLDGTSPSSVVEIQHVPLTSANAFETVRLIEDVLSGRSLGGRRPNDRATVLRYVRQAEGGADGSEMEVSTALRESINLTPDVRTNTIIVKAPSDSMGLLIDMIRDLDESSVGSKNVRIFKLENADASAMAALLKDLFRLDEGEDLLILKPRETMEVTDLGGGMIEESVDFAGTELTAVPDPRQQLAITVDSRTNSLIVSGTPAYLDLVQSVIDELDALDANERETFLYQLRNSTASDVADVLGDFVETEQQKLIETIGMQQLGSAARLLEREITIRGDDKSNSVLVSASPRYMDRIKDVIQELDVDPPQVLIQVLLAEVTLDGGVDWGVQMDTSGGGSFAFNMTLAAPGLATGLPAMTLGISDFSIVLKALENQGRLHILSNPSIMAANNETANINVGEIIYVPVGAQTYDTGLTSVPLEEKEVGVLLTVKPSINPDGYVRMVVQPTLSKLAKETDSPAFGITTPRIIQRTADTTVTVRDGQTVVIGGLINEAYEYKENKVPLLGDIPILGLLFKSEFEELVRTELVIVLTPHVITSPTAFDRITGITDQQIDRVTLPPELLERIRQGEIEDMGLFHKDGYKLQLRNLEEEIAPEAAEESEAP